MRSAAPLAAGVLSASLLLRPLAAPAASFTVDSTADAVDTAPGDGVCATSGNGCTLRAAVQEANALAGPDTIDIPAGTYVLTLTGAGEDAAATGDLDLTGDVTITGAGVAQTIIDGNGTDRIFDIFNSVARAEISGLTIQNGNPGPGPGSYGGGIYNSGTTTLSNVAVTGSTAAVNGGGIENDNDLTLINCVVSGNTAATFGGGLDNALTMRLVNTTVSGNTAGTGGGLGSISDLTLTNVTVSGNTATVVGGGLENDVTAALTNVTIAGNSAPSGGGLNTVGITRFAYVIVASGAAGGTCAGGGTQTSLGHNLDSANTCGFGGPGDLINTDPQLGPLQDNGGPTLTQALLEGSPAIDAGGSDCPPPAIDQRGISRPLDGNGDGVATCDIGAYEFGAQVMPCPVSATFDSIECRLGELIGTLETVVAPGALRDGLQKPLTRARDLTTQAQQTLASGKRRRAKSMLGGAARQLGKFTVRLRSRKARAIPDTSRASLKTAAVQLRNDLLMLRRSS